MQYNSQMEERVLETNPFQTFWMAGFECTDQLNAFGNRVDFLQITQHFQNLDQDYDNLSLFNIGTVREGIRWSQVEKQPYQYDWTTVEEMIHAGKRNNIQQVWDICHFGYADDLTPLHPMFARRFSALCRAFVKFYTSVCPGEILIVTPINEVSFISWLGGDVCGTSPYCRHYGWEVKYKLMGAYIEGVEAKKQELPGVRIMTTEPLVNVISHADATEEDKQRADDLNEAQFQVLEILSGKKCPELGGKPEYLDLLGFNYYYNNQWEEGTCNFLCWKQEVPDPRWKTLSTLLAEVYVRYQRPIILSETSHPGEDRPLWIEMLATQCAILLKQNIPLWGVCWYPVIDRPDWDNLQDWHHAGLWDHNDTGFVTTRLLHNPTAKALLQMQQSVM